MKLLTEKIKRELPKIYETEYLSMHDKIIVCKFFNPCGLGTWYVVEGEARGDDYIFFGLVELIDNEWGYFSLKELEAIELPFGMRIERDKHFSKTKTSVILKEGI